MGDTGVEPRGTERKGVIDNRFRGIQPGDKIRVVGGRQSQY